MILFLDLTILYGFSYSNASYIYMDLTVDPKEYTGAVHPSDVAEMTKKEKEKEKEKISLEKEKFCQHGFRDIFKP